jgi:hypothetical protein
MQWLCADKLPSMAQPQQPLPVALPPPPNDPNDPLPTAPVYPPTRNNVQDAQLYRRHVKISIGTLVLSCPERRAAQSCILDEGAAGVKCTPQDDYNSLLYKHDVITQAATAATPIGTNHLSLIHTI